MPTTPRHRDSIAALERRVAGTLKTLDYSRPGAGALRVVNGRIGAAYEDEDGNWTYDVVVWGGWPLRATGEIVEGAMAWGQSVALAIDTAVQVSLRPGEIPQIAIGAVGGSGAEWQFVPWSEGEA